MPVPRHHVFAYVDIEGSSRLSGPQKLQARHDLAGMLDRARSRAGIADLDKGDRGDGALLVSRSPVPIRTVLESFAGEIDESLAARTVGDLRLRLRLIVHQGDVDHDGEGWSGHELDRAARMVDAPEVKAALAEVPEGRLALVLAPEVYHNVVRGYALLRPTAFRMCRVTAKDGPLETWLTITGTAVQPGREADTQEGARPEPAAPTQLLSRDWKVKARDSVVGSQFSGGVRFGADPRGDR